jgi:hypothetical protein
VSGSLVDVAGPRSLRFYAQTRKFHSHRSFLFFVPIHER